VGSHAYRPAWAGAGAAIPDIASAPVIAKTIAIAFMNTVLLLERGELIADIEPFA
jgi:hypothetical protein